MAAEPVRHFDPFAGPHLADPHPPLAEARRRAPVFFSPELRTWVVTRYDDVARVLAAPGEFSSAVSITNVPGPPPPPVLEVLAAGIPYDGGLVDMDPPRHTAVRRMFVRAFSPRRVAGLEGAVRDRTRRLLDDLGGPPADLVAGLAHPLPVLVIAGLFGVPETDLADFKRWSDEWLVLLAQRAELDRIVEAARAVVDFQHYIAGLIDARRRDPRPDDLLTDLLRTDAENAEPLGTGTLVGVVMTVLFAGHETTSGLIANAAYQLCRHPVTRAETAADPSLVDRLLAEVLRFDPPVPSMYRTATKDVELGGVALPAGAHLQLSYLSANRDESVFTDPDSFDVHRPDAHLHLGFGRGLHYCIGSALALLEARVAVTELLTRAPALHLAAGFTRTPVQSATIRTTPSLLVTW